MHILNFLLALPLVIKNYDLPVCVNCYYFIENKMNNQNDIIPDNNLGRCKLFSAKKYCYL